MSSSTTLICEGTPPPPLVPTVTETPIVTATPPENTSENCRVGNYASCQGGKLALPIVPCTDTNAIIDTYAQALMQPTAQRSCVTSQEPQE